MNTLRFCVTAVAVLGLLALGLTLGGCGSQSGGPADEGTGAIEGWVYLTPAQAAAVTAGTTFQVSTVAQPSLGSVPAGTTGVSLSSGGASTTIDRTGHYRIEGITPGVYSLALLSQSGQTTLSETFGGLLVAPDATTYGLGAPAGYSVRIAPPATTTVAAGAQLTLTAELAQTTSGQAVAFAGPFTWTSEQPAVASVSQGVVSGLTEGTAWIRASAGPLFARIQVTVQGGTAHQAAVLTSSATVAAVAGTTRISAFSLQVPGGSVALPAGSLALVTPPAGSPVTTLTPTASGDTLALPGPVTVSGTGVMLLTFRAPSGEAIAFTDALGGTAHVEQVQFRCGLPQVGTVLFPADLALALPVSGAPASVAYAEFGGVPAGGEASLTLEPGGTRSDTPDASGDVRIEGFPAATTVTTLSAVRLEVLGP